MAHSIYFDRTPGKLYGVLTLQYAGSKGVIKVFDKIPVASGQNGFLHPDNDWANGKGATPFGKHWMSTKKVPLQMEPKGTPFYMISTEKGGSVIHGPGNAQRTACGLHLENGHPGSIGCTVLLHSTPEQECTAWALFAYLDKLNKYEPYIRFEVL